MSARSRLLRWLGIVGPGWRSRSQIIGPIDGLDGPHGGGGHGHWGGGGRRWRGGGFPGRWGGYPYPWPYWGGGELVAVATPTVDTATQQQAQEALQLSRQAIEQAAVAQETAAQATASVPWLEREAFLGLPWWAVLLGGRGRVGSARGAVVARQSTTSERAAVEDGTAPMIGPYSFRAPDGTIVSCWWTAQGWTCDPPPWYWGWGDGGVYPWMSDVAVARSGRAPAPPRLQFDAGGMRHGRMRPAGLGENGNALSVLTSWPYRALAIAGTVLGAFHGYKRNSSVGWAIVWGLLGGAFPFFTIPVSLAQGFGKKRNPSRRRRNAQVRLKPGQKWQRGSGEAWKACVECATAIGPFMSVEEAEAHDASCRRCTALETATTGTYRAAKRRNRRRARVMNRRERGPYFYYARGFSLGRQGMPLSALGSLTSTQRQAAEEGYLAGEMAMTAQAVTEPARRRM